MLETHQSQTSSQAYNFSNIRYGAPPIGDLRFAAPVPPTTDRSVVQKGEEARICPQALPDWTPGLLEQAYQYVLGPNISLSGGQLLDSRASEDCLFLDVVVPKKIFDATKSNETATKAPVSRGSYDLCTTIIVKEARANRDEPNRFLFGSTAVDTTLAPRLGLTVARLQAF